MVRVLRPHFKDGYFTYTDSITGEEVTIYDINYDLQGKIDLFFKPYLLFWN